MQRIKKTIQECSVNQWFGYQGMTEEEFDGTKYPVTEKEEQVENNVFIMTDEEIKKLKQYFIDDIRTMLYDYDIEYELRQTLEENIKVIINNW